MLQINLIPKWKYRGQEKAKRTVGAKYEFDRNIINEKMFEEINIWLPVLWKFHKKDFIKCLSDTIEHEIIHKICDDEGAVSRFLDE